MLSEKSAAVRAGYTCTRDRTDGGSFELLGLELGMCGHGIDLCGGQGLLILLQGRLRRLRPATNPWRADLKADVDGSLLERGVLGLKVLSLRGRVRGIREGSACVDISQ